MAMVNTRDAKAMNATVDPELDMQYMLKKKNTKRILIFNFLTLK